MFIKQVVIKGFKSLREQIATEDFSPKVNCIVDANRSGKTDFLHAICFGLTHLSQNLRDGDRNALLHEEAGHPVLPAFVEIVFDNSDSRIPNKKGKVQLRRSIETGEYLLDGKDISATRVMNLLRMAGCLKPYCVVHREEITSLTLMGDYERLNLLKGIGHTKVYEEKLREKLKIMLKIGKKQNDCIKDLQDVKNNLKGLDVDEDDLQKFEMTRNLLQYAIYKREVIDAKLRLKKIPDDRKNVTEEHSQKYHVYMAEFEKIQKSKSRLKDLTEEHQKSTESKEVIEKQQTTAFERILELNRDLGDLHKKISLAKGDKSLHATAESTRMELQIAITSFSYALHHLQRDSERINDLSRQIADINAEINEFKYLQDEFNRALRDSAITLKQLRVEEIDLHAKIKENSNITSKVDPSVLAASEEMYAERNFEDLKETLLWYDGEYPDLHQHIRLTEQQEKLEKIHTELGADYEKIREQISKLDQQKDESIKNTFEDVDRHFQNVFPELVKEGHGHLVLIKVGDHDDDDQEEDGPRETRAEKYIGVKVKVSFTRQGNTQCLKQLLGNEKIVAALTLIFAIQRCDPAPFYLFDKIDAALDPQCRTAVGNMIRRLANTNTQFITTTFHQEPVKVADKIFGVTHKNTVSYVNVISKNDALKIINQDQTQNAE